jgi:hypothetical protein
LLSSADPSWRNLAVPRSFPCCRNRKQLQGIRVINGVVTLTRRTEHGARRWPRDDGIAVLLRRQDSRPLQNGATLPAGAFSTRPRSISFESI